MKNKYCDKSTLRNESDVEQFFVIRLLKDLGYKDTDILTKHAIPEFEFGKGKKKKRHIPDYQVRVGKTPVFIVEAKHPELLIDEHITEAQDYATAVNREFIGKNPIRYIVVTNGIKTKLAKVDENNVILDLDFEDFVNGNEKFRKLHKYISLKASKSVLAITKEDGFEFRTPELAELKGVFKQSHDLIRRKQKIGPKKAFYEFTKLLFVKLNEDKIIQKKLSKNELVSIDDFNFSTRKIEKTNDNWINTLFEQYRDALDGEVRKGKKRKIFQTNEKINLSPSTVKAIVGEIENINLRSVEDDINGKVFETFLEAAVRGKELGQFFTPRSVVKFMVQMAELGIFKNAETGEYEPVSVLDGSCGTGGFLIFSLSDLFKKIKSHSNQDSLKKQIREKSLFGIDASEDDIVPITRMNMYLHGDGGSHIFLADTLDKELLVETGVETAKKDEITDLKKLLRDKKFDIVLTNPPFSMKYEQSKPDEKRILEQYEIASLGASLARSLKSNLMFLERYHDLLKPGGKLLTVIDESVLNTEGQAKSMLKFRKWLRSKFIIRAVVSLPHNTFVNADAGVKTSVLYLTKRVSEDEQQPPVFMAISKDIGHNDAGRITSEWGDLSDILESFIQYQSVNH